ICPRGCPHHLISAAHRSRPPLPPPRSETKYRVLQSADTTAWASRLPAPPMEPSGRLSGPVQVASVAGRKAENSRALAPTDASSMVVPAITDGERQADE